MDITKALVLFDALSQETRLRVFRLLVQAGPDGLAAGELSKKLGTPHNTLSFHLNHLANADAVLSRRQGRSILYSANYDTAQAIIEFLVKDCCRGEVEFKLGNCCEGVVTQATKTRKHK